MSGVRPVPSDEDRRNLHRTFCSMRQAMMLALDEWVSTEPDPEHIEEEALGTIQAVAQKAQLACSCPDGV
jgi:hypothetical protein